MTKNELKLLIAKNKTQKAIDELLSMPEVVNDGQEIFDLVILLSSRYERCMAEKRAGTLTFENLQVELNNINLALLDIIQHLPAQQENNTPGKGAKPKSGLVQLHIAQSFSGFDAIKREHLIGAISGMLNIKRSEVLVRQVSGGSIYILLEMPKVYAVQLISIFKAGTAADILEQTLHISNIELKGWWFVVSDTISSWFCSRTGVLITLGIAVLIPVIYLLNSNPETVNPPLPPVPALVDVILRLDHRPVRPLILVNNTPVSSWTAGTDTAEIVLQGLTSGNDYTVEVNDTVAACRGTIRPTAQQLIFTLDCRRKIIVPPPPDSFAIDIITPFDRPEITVNEEQAVPINTIAAAKGFFRTSLRLPAGACLVGVNDPKDQFDCTNNSMEIDVHADTVIRFLCTKKVEERRTYLVRVQVALLKNKKFQWKLNELMLFLNGRPSGITPHKAAKNINIAEFVVPVKAGEYSFGVATATDYVISCTGKKVNITKDSTLVLNCTDQGGTSWPEATVTLYCPVDAKVKGKPLDLLMDGISMKYKEVTGKKNMIGLQIKGVKISKKKRQFLLRNVNPRFNCNEMQVPIDQQTVQKNFECRSGK